MPEPQLVGFAPTHMHGLAGAENFGVMLHLDGAGSPLSSRVPRE